MSIKVNHLSHIYNPGLPHEWVALKDIDFSVADGKFLGIIGHTGSGKSTLLQHLNGLLKATEGSVSIGDVTIGDKDVSLFEIRKKIGLVFQYPEYQLFEETVAKDVAYGPQNLGLEEDEIENRVTKALTMVGLDREEIGEKNPFDLSGGQKRRAAIAGVIAMEPEVLILDEPTAGLDPRSHREILEMIQRIHEETGNITILVSHNMNDIARLSDQVMVMERGEIALMGSPEEVFSNKEKLVSMGLDLPDVMNIGWQLRERGWDINDNKMTIEELTQEIQRVLKEEDHD